VDVVLAIIVVVALAALLLVLRLLAWCLTDVLRDPTLTQYEQSMWFVFLLIVCVVAVPLYITVGPGSNHWDSSMFWPW
jgi:hypothetical protein